MALESQRLSGDVAIVSGAASGLDRGIAVKGGTLTVTEQRTRL
jgi:hypothetical protein